MHEYADTENPTKAVIYGETADSFKLGGYGVVFGGRDLEGEFFDKDTDFWLDRLTRTPPVLYQHGRDKRAQTHVIGKGIVSDPDDIGLWVEAQIALADEYAEAIRELASTSKLGWSSGTAGHLAERDGARIKSWPIVEMSLTPTPAEPRTLGVSEIRSLTEWADGLKGLLPETEGDSVAEAEQVAETAETITEPMTIITIKETEMPEEEKVVAAPEPSMADMIQAAVTKAMANLPGFDKAMYANPEGTDRATEKSFGDYLVAMQRGDTKRLRSVYSSTKDVDELTGESGGYLVPPEYTREIFRLVEQRSVVRSQNPGPRVFPMAGRELYLPSLDQSGSTAGVRPTLGGVRAYWGTEGTAPTESQPTFGQIKLMYNPLWGYTEVTNMARSDAGPTLDALLRELFADAIAFYEDWAFINGTGAGEPLGVLKSPALVCEVAATSSFVLSDVAGMLKVFKARGNNRGTFLMHPAVIEKLIPLADGSGAANNLIWIPSARDDAPATLMGRPITFTDVMPVLPAGAVATQIGGVLLADWSYYAIGQRGGLQIDFSADVEFKSFKGVWRFAEYIDGAPMLKAAVYYADGTNTYSPFVSLKGA